VNCSDFLQDYSSYRDGLGDDRRMGEFQAHLRACDSCARYDRVIGGGVELVRDLEPVEASSDFMDRLQHRIYHVDEEMRVARRASSGASMMVTIAIAALIGATAWAPTIRSEVPVIDLPPVVASAPVRVEPLPSLFRQGPLLTEAPPAFRAGDRSESVFFRYSPLGVYGGDTQAVLASQGTNAQ
jgi:hypothetical protein